MCFFMVCEIRRETASWCQQRDHRIMLAEKLDTFMPYGNPQEHSCPVYDPGLVPLEGLSPSRCP